MENTVEAQLINDFLAQGPFIPLTDKPLFRLVWSSDQYEVRIATLRDYIGETFIRERKVEENILKYNWIKDRWIFEQWYPPESVFNEELPESRMGSYEPLYVFEDSKGNVLPLNIKVIQLMYNRLVNKPKSSSALIRSTIEEEMLIKEQRLDNYTMDALDISTDIQSNLHFGEGIIVPSNYEVESPNRRIKDDTI